MNVVLLCLFACRPAPFFTVWGGQPKGEPPLADFKFLAARVRVCVDLAAALRVLCRKCRQPLFEIGVVGLDFLDEKGRTVPMLPNFFEIF